MVDDEDMTEYEAKAKDNVGDKGEECAVAGRAGGKRRLKAKLTGNRGWGEDSIGDFGKGGIVQHRIVWDRGMAGYPGVRARQTQTRQ